MTNAQILSKNLQKLQQVEAKLSALQRMKPTTAVVSLAMRLAEVRNNLKRNLIINP